MRFYVRNLLGQNQSAKAGGLQSVHLVLVTDVEHPLGAQQVLAVQGARCWMSTRWRARFVGLWWGVGSRAHGCVVTKPTRCKPARLALLMAWATNS